MNLPENLRLAGSTILLALIGVVYYALAEIVDHDLVPLLLDQGDYVFSATDPSAAMGRWNFFSYLFSVVASGFVCAVAVILFAGHGNWVTTLPAVITATMFYGFAYDGQYFRIYPVAYDVIEVLVMIVALPSWYMLLQVFLNRLKRDATT